MWPFSLDYRVYAAGGMGLDLRPHNHLQHYDMLKDMWVSLAPMPTPRYAATSFLRGSKIYVLGKDMLSVPHLSLLLSWGPFPQEALTHSVLPVQLSNSQKGKRCV